MVIATESKTAILALTAGGARLAERLAGLLGDVQLYLPERLAQEGLATEVRYFNHWQRAAEEAFHGYRRLIFIMASVIVVRTLAPFLVSKRSDPAVLVLDEQGQFVISLLSGHLGGANLLAERVAKLLGGTAVITTATDVNGVPALDLLAQKLECEIYPMSKVKVFNRLLVEGEPVGLFSQWPLPESLRAGFDYRTKEERNEEKATVYITNKRLWPKDQGLRLLLRPRNLVVGVGCRRGVSREQIISAVKGAFRLAGLSLLSLQAIATVDLKMNEPGLQQAASYYKVPLVEVTRDQIQQLGGCFTPSEFVQEKIGVGGVCEPAAQIVSGRGKLILPKQKMGPVTVAIAEARLWWWA